MAGALVCLVATIMAALAAKWVLTIHWAVGIAVTVVMARKNMKATVATREPKEE